MDDEVARARQWQIDRYSRKVFQTHLRNSLIAAPEHAARVRASFRGLQEFLGDLGNSQEQDVDSERFNFGRKQDEESKRAPVIQESGGLKLGRD
jgi:hypothetical protein